MKKEGYEAWAHLNEVLSIRTQEYVAGVPSSASSLVPQ